MHVVPIVARERTFHKRVIADVPFGAIIVMVAMGMRGAMFLSRGRFDDTAEESAAFFGAHGGGDARGVVVAFQRTLAFLTVAEEGGVDPGEERLAEEHLLFLGELAALGVGEG